MVFECGDTGVKCLVSWMGNVKDILIICTTSESSYFISIIQYLRENTWNIFEIGTKIFVDYCYYIIGVVY